MEVMSSMLELFEPVAVQKSIQKVFTQELTPISTIQRGSPITFAYAGTDQVYPNLAESELYLKIQIQTDAGADLGANVQVAPVNNILHSLISNVLVELNGRSVTDQNGLYQFQAYIESLTTYGAAAQESEMQAEGWYLDKPGQLNDFASADNSPNTGLVARRKLFATSREVELMGRLRADIFNVNKALLPNVPIKITLTFAPTYFVLKHPAPGQGQAEPNYRINILEARYMLPCILASAELALSHEKMLQSVNARYMVPRVTVKTVAIPAQSRTLSHDNIYLGTLPESLIICFVREEYMGSNRQGNPFNFQHHDINYLALYMNGETIPSRPYTPNFDSGLYIREYRALYDALHKKYSNEGLTITRDSFAQGFCLFAFDLSTDKNNLACLSGPRTGSIRLEVKFANPLGHTVCAILFAQFESILEIDKYRNVITEAV